MAAESVGDRLRRFRRIRGLSQEELSERAGVRRDYIGSLEASPTKVPREPDQLKLLATALGVKLRDLAEPTGWYEGEPDPDPEEWVIAMRGDPTLTDDGKRIIADMAELMRQRAEKS